ncbi:MAG: zinc finger domain-containing protein [Candidatus Hydrothermae bacterium]|nr:zinc finger domain-containing protein [Candidatus Hydrothermae bacterium]
MSAIQLDSCFSCNRTLSPVKRGSSRFPCPQCGARIMRCADCSRASNTYVCPGCDFTGP